MSVYRPKGSRLYVYDFQRGGRRFLGPTGEASRRKAEDVEAERKAQASLDIAAGRHAEAEMKGALPLTLDVAAGRWWSEVGQHRADSKDCWLTIEKILDHFGNMKRLDQISDSDVARWVAATRGQLAWGKARLQNGKPGQPLSAARVNRLTVDALRRIYGRARKSWKVMIASEPDWKQHRLAEADELTRELSADEQAAITEAAHPDYERTYRFARLSGLRLGACLIRKSDVKWDLNRIDVKSKGGKLNRVPISESIRDVLAECWDDHHDFVFTYAARRTHRKTVKGRRYPITYSGLKSQWKRDRLAAAKTCPSILTFQFHDNRHTAATRILRETGNLKIAQRLLNHARIGTTAKYAHVLDEEVLAAMNATPDGDKKSRGQSRGRRRNAA